MGGPDVPQEPEQESRPARLSSKICVLLASAATRLKEKRLRCFLSQQYKVSKIDYHYPSSNKRSQYETLSR
jgi:hypothetical protein